MKGSFNHSLFLTIYFFVCLGLIVAVLLQTTKSEGLTGTIGGRIESPFLKKSWEDNLSKITTYLAIAFLALSALFSIIKF